MFVRFVLAVCYGFLSYLGNLSSGYVVSSLCLVKLKTQNLLNINVTRFIIVLNLSNLLLLFKREGELR